MFIWDYYPLAIVYVCATVVAACDFIINFYVVNIYSWVPQKSETLEE